MFSTVSCSQEYQTSRQQVDGTTNQITASVVLRCAFNDREALVADILGNSRVWPFSSSAGAAPVAQRATIVDAPGYYATVGQLITPLYSLVTVEYGVPNTSTVGAFEKVAESIEPATEFITLDYRNFRWGSSSGEPLKKGEEPGFQVTKVMLVRRIYKVPTPLNPLTLTAIGKTNDATYASSLLGYSFPAETLLYMDPVIERTLGTAGANYANYTQRWCYNPNGWNKYWRAETETWEEIYSTDRVTGGAPVKNYPPMNLAALFG